MLSNFQPPPKFARVLVTFFVLLAQVHICPPIYITEQGTHCSACAVISEPDDCAQIIADPHGDCHDCCSIKSCDDGMTKQLLMLSSVNPWNFPFALPTHSLQVIGPELSSPQGQIEFDPSAPSTGPPRNRSSRAPPLI